MQSRCGIRNEMGMAQPIAEHVPGNRFGELLGNCRGGSCYLESVEKLPQNAEAGVVKDYPPPPPVTVNAPSVITHRTSERSWSLVWAV